MRLFDEASWWNQPIPEGAPVAAESAEWMRLQQEFCGHGLHLNLSEWTIPIVVVDDSVPRVRLHRLFERGLQEHSFLSRALGEHRWGHGPGIEDGVPIPEHAAADPSTDAHLCLVHRDTGQAWDMWCARKLPDGSWGAYAACTYRIDGSGILDDPAYRPVLGESIHLYGPSRAAGVPIPAGLIFRDEVAAGEIRHRLAVACEYVGRHRYVSPSAMWTDGWYEGGIPEGAVLQLDPGLDLEPFHLSPGGRVVARALQVYGAAVVDYARGGALYGEYASATEWSPWLTASSLHGIPYHYYRVLRLGEERVGGDSPSRPNPPVR